MPYFVNLKCILISLKSGCVLQPMTSHNHCGQETGGPAAMAWPCAVVPEILTIILDDTAIP